MECCSVDKFEVATVMHFIIHFYFYLEHINPASWFSFPVSTMWNAHSYINIQGALYWSYTPIEDIPRTEIELPTYPSGQINMMVTPSRLVIKLNNG